MEFPAELEGKKGLAGLGKGPSWRHTVGDREEAHVRVLARRAGGKLFNVDHLAPD